MAQDPNIGCMLALAILAVACVVLVLWPGYNDNLVQRLGASVTCLSALGKANSLYQGIHDPVLTITVFSGILVIVIGTFFKLPEPPKGTDHAA